MKNHIKKIISSILAVVIVFGCIGPPVNAATSDSARASNYFFGYQATLSAVGNGKLRIKGNVEAMSTMTSIGISYFRVYLEDGTFVTTVPGSTTNGLLTSNSDSYNGSFTYQAVAGNTYYVIVTFICRNANGYDCRNYTTTKVKA